MVLNRGIAEQDVEKLRRIVPGRADRKIEHDGVLLSPDRLDVICLPLLVPLDGTLDNPLSISWRRLDVS